MATPPAVSVVMQHRHSINRHIGSYSQNTIFFELPNKLVFVPGRLYQSILTFVSYLSEAVA
jgi:hypothetical protein